MKTIVFLFLSTSNKSLPQKKIPINQQIHYYEKKKKKNVVADATK